MAMLSIVDYIVLAGMLLVSMAIGVYYAWVGRNETKEDFLMGSRKMRTFPVALSLMASFLSPISILGWPAEIYSQGIQMTAAILSSIGASLISAEVFMPIYYKMKLTSVNTYLTARFNSDVLRIITSITICIAMLPWLGVVLYSPSLVLQTTTGLSLSSCILLTGLAVTIYTSIGGLKAVVWTDVVQFTLMFLGLFVVIIKGTWDVGGVKKVFERAHEGGRTNLFNFEFSVYMSNNFWMVVLGTFTVWAGGNSASQIIVQRTCTLPTLAKAKEVIYITLPGFVLNNLIVTFLGLVLFATYSHCDPILSGKIEKVDQLVPHFVAESFGSNFPGIPGLFVACICSASLSTLSSALNAMSALIWEDWLSKLFTNCSVRTEVLLTKIVAALVGLVCIVTAFLTSAFRTIFQAAFALSGAPNGPVFGVFLMGIFLPFTNAAGALSGLLMGQLVCTLIIAGSLAYPYDLPQLPTAAEGPTCSISPNATTSPFPFDELRNYHMPIYEPEGIKRIFHLSHFFIPFVGLAVSLVVGITVSYFTGGNKGRKVDRQLLHPIVSKFMEKNFKSEKLNVSSNGHEAVVFIAKGKHT